MPTYNIKLNIPVRMLNTEKEAHEMAEQILEHLSETFKDNQTFQINEATHIVAKVNRLDILQKLIDRYNESQSSEDHLIADHIQSVLDSNKEEDPGEQVKYVQSSIEEVIESAEHVIQALN